jgi:nucleotide-binding universal stress UspA family protein
LAYDRILVALDGSEPGEQILPHVEALARAFNSTVILLRATTPPETIIAQTTPVGEPVAPGILDPTELVEAEQLDASDYLQDVAARLRARGLTSRIEQAEGSAADLILESAAATGADLIAMTTHGRGGLERLVFGSVADHVLRHATCPVLLVRVVEEPLVDDDEKARTRDEVPVI